MHNVRGRQAAQLGNFSGLVTLAHPENLPAGASPRTVNTDFSIGGVGTRGSLVNPFVYQNGAIGPSPGHTAVDYPTGNMPWQNPGNILSPGSYATSEVGPLALQIVSVAVIPNQFPSAPGSSALFQPGYLTVVTFGVNAPLYQQGQLYTFSGLTAFTSLNGQTLAPYTGRAIEYPNQVMFAFGASQYASTPDTGTAIVSGKFMGTDALDVTEFAFSVSPTQTPQGFEITVEAYATSPATMSVQMLRNGAPVGSIATQPVSTTPGTITFGGMNSLFGSTWNAADVNSVQFGAQISVYGSQTAQIFARYLNIRAYLIPQQTNFNYVTTFEDSFGNIKTLALDAAGAWWLEDVTNNPGVLTPLMGGYPAESYASSFKANSRQYIAASDLSSGVYVPQQYNGSWTDRVSQVGPGAAPTFTPISAQGTQFPIVSITQPAAKSQASSYYLQSAGPGNTSPGNVVTFYYLDSTVVSGPDADLVNAFNSGFPVYLWAQFSGGSGGQGNVNFGPQVVLVTSVGLGKPPGQPRQYYYFTFNVATVAYNFTDESSSLNIASYQRSLATMTTSTPVPGLEVGGIATVVGSSASGYNNQWTIAETPNAGAMTITETSVSGGVATFSYALVSGTAPLAGQLVTVTGTNNDNGGLNVVSAAIASASGGTNGTFTVNVSLPDAIGTAEQGQATTAGTIFEFDPGAVLVGSGTNPIYGSASGGNLTYAASGQFMSAGTRKGTVFFITRNGYWTRPAPPVTFSAAGNITGIQVTNLPIGPPNVVARGVAFTEAGQNGVPGANFYTIPEPVSYVVENVTYNATPLIVSDNTSTSATFQFSDAVLLAAEEIDIPGADLFNLGELPESGWCAKYAGRTIWGRVRTSVQNFLNLSFDGGYLANPGGNRMPLGWQLEAATVSSGAAPTLNVSPVFGNSLYMANLGSVTIPVMNRFYQSASQDWNQVAILQNQTAYSVRVRCRTPSGAVSGALIIDLATFSAATGWGAVYGSFALNLASMTTAMAEYSGTLLTNSTLTIPPNLMLRVWGQNMPENADLEIDSISIFPTEEPTNLTALAVSYRSDPESIDLVTGGIDTSVVNAQPANGAFILRDNLYIAKESSLVYVSDAPNQEPANWNPPREVSNVAGACGPYAFDVGEEWAVMACQNGLFVFNGGQPMPIQLEIQALWRQINWAVAQSIVVRNDVSRRRMYLAIPLATPNVWMPTAATNNNPTTPNVILMLNYEGIESVERLMESDALHVTMFGKLAVLDMRRKWSLWTIPTPYIGLIKRNELDREMMFCNGIGSSKIYEISNQITGTDDGTPFSSSYCTYGYIDQGEAQQNPMFGAYNKRWNYYDAFIAGSGNASLTFFPNTLVNPNPEPVPGGITLQNPPVFDLEGPLNEFAERLFAEIAITDGWFQLGRLTLAGSSDAWSQVRGA